MNITVYPGSLAYAGSPIIVTATNESADWSAGTSPTICMTHIEAVVRVDGVSKSYKFSAETDMGKSFVCDVSSAVRAALHGIDYMSKYNSKASTLWSSAPTLTVYAYVSHMSEGSYFEGLGKVSGNKQQCASVVYVFPGALSEIERISNTVPTNGDVLSTKPDGECVTEDHIMVLSILRDNMPRMAYNECKSSSTSLAFDKDKTINRSVYVDKKERTEFLFVNSRGVLEDASAVMLESLSIDINKSQYDAVNSPSYLPLTRSMAARPVKPRKKWNMSSGNVTKAWAQWWAEEFLCSGQYWMKINSNWIPVSIVPGSSSVQIYDKSKAQACHVDFTVTCGLRG